MITKFYLEYEYNPPQHYPITFENSLSLILPPPPNDPSEDASPPTGACLPIMPPTKPQSRKLIKIGSKDITRQPDGHYRFHLWDHQFSSLYELVLALSPEYSCETIFAAFSWQEFEDFITSACLTYGYHAFRTFRYSIKKKRHEVDVIARENQRIFFIDAKRWTSQTASLSALSLAAEQQVLRAKHLVQDLAVVSRLLHQLHVPLRPQRRQFLLYPIILVSSNVSSNTIINGASIVAFSHFNAFLNDFSKIAPDLLPIMLEKPSDGE